MAKKVVTFGRLREGGRSAVYREDFKYHTEGEGWRHTADQTDMNPPLPDIGGALHGLTVQETLESIASYLSSLSSGGYVTVGLVGSSADYIVDPSTNPLEQALSDAFSDSRLTGGRGTILIKSGVYSIGDTVDIPAGVTIMGDPSGTFIYGHTAERSMFHIAKSDIIPRLGDNGSDMYSSESINGTRLYNLVIGDNTDESYTSGGNPVPTMATVPMIDADVGSNLSIERVTFLGYYRSGFGVTKRAIAYSGSASEPTILDVNHCVFDGFFGTIEFASSQGYKDILKVNKNRVYMFNDASVSLQDDAFVSFNLCNASFEGNYIEFMQSDDGICFGLTSDSVPDPDKCSVNIINNTGTPVDINVGYNKFFVNEFTSDTKILLLGNNFGSRVNNDYFFIIGDGEASVGDLTGPNALDLAIKRLNSIGAYKPTIILNAGTYTLSESNTSRNIRLIGNSTVTSPDAGGVIIVLDSDSSVQDIAGNDTQYLGDHIQNIQFKVADSTSFQTITVSALGSDDVIKEQTIKNCSFFNCGLYFEDISNVMTVNRNVINCSFNQNNDYDNNLSFYCGTRYNTLVLEGCSFSGYGYAVGIGYFNQESDPGPTGYKQINKNITINNCIFILNSGSENIRIDKLSPLNDGSYLGEFNPNKYIFIYNDSANVIISNTTIKCVGEMEMSSIVVDDSILEKTKFDSFIKIKANGIFLDNVFAVGTNQLFEISEDDYQLPLFNLTPINKLNVTNCNMIGTLPIYLNYNSFSSALMTLGRGFYVNISDSKFTTFNNDVLSSPASNVCTLIGMVLKDTEMGSIVIDNCSIFQNISMEMFGTTNYKNYSIENLTSTDSAKFGAVLIYAPNWDVSISNCSISTITYDDPTGDGDIYSGVSVSNAAIVQYGSPRISINNNNITTVGGVDDSPIAYFYSLVVNGFVSYVNNNVINTTGLSSISSGSHLGNLYLGPAGYGHVSGNTIIWDDIVLKNHVVLQSVGGGIFKNNIFDQVTFAAYGDPDSRILSVGGWIVSDNKNQRVDINVTGGSGTFIMGESYPTDSATIADFASSFGQTDVESRIYTDCSDSTVHFFYLDYPDIWGFAWEIPIEEVVPEGAFLHSVILDYDADSVFTSSGDLGLSLIDSSGSLTETDDLTTNTSSQLICQNTSPSTRFKSGVSGDHLIVASLNCNSSSFNSVKLKMSIRYQW